MDPHYFGTLELGEQQLRRLASRYQLDPDTTASQWVATEPSVRHCRRRLRWLVGSLGLQLQESTTDVHSAEVAVQCGSKNAPPPEDLWQFFQNSCYAILSVTTQLTSCAQNVHRRPKRMLAFSDIFPKQLAIFSPHFTHLLNVHTHAKMQIFVQLGLSPTMTKLSHIKWDDPACVNFGRWWTF